MQIKELESVVGLPAFEPRGPGLRRLTMSGEYLLVYARRVLGTAEEAEDAMARLRGAQSGRITIGMVSTAKYFLPRLLARFRAEHRGVEMQLAVGNREQAGSAAARQRGRPRGDGPAAARAGHARRAVRRPAARRGGVARAPAGATARHPAVGAGSEEFIVREPGSGTRAAMEQFFREHHLARRR